MNGYSKINSSSKAQLTKFGSIDYPDGDTHKRSPNPTSKTQPTQQSKTHEDFPDQKPEEKGIEDVFGMVLHRSYSVSTSCSKRFKSENPSSLQSTLRRAFSMKRSSSVSERYCRIHDQSDYHFSPPPNDGAAINMMQQTRSKKKKRGILKACKCLFGLT